MLLTIFGAGASYDSVDLSVVPQIEFRVRAERTFRPPLANQLFDEREEFVDAMNRFPQMSALVPRLRRASKTSGRAVEETLREIQEEAIGYPERLAHLMALEFYLSEILDEPVTQWIKSVGGATNYVELLDQIKRVSLMPPLLLVTFNYDRMLEEAIAELLMFNIRHLADYLTRTFRLIKPHGSVDWVYKLPGFFRYRDARMPMATAVIEQSTAPGIRDGEIIMKSQITEQHVVLWRPAVAIPLDQGKTFVCPSDHLSQLETDLEGVTRILVVGWRATERHFLKMLSERLPKNRPISLCIVDKDDGAAATRMNLESALGHTIAFRPTEIHTKGFSDFVSGAKVQSWLSSPLESF